MSFSFLGLLLPCPEIRGLCLIEWRRASSVFFFSPGSRYKNLLENMFHSKHGLFHYQE